MTGKEKKPLLTIIKIGGAVIDREEELHAFLESFALQEGPVLLVHGGGKIATELAVRMGLPQQMVAGRRVTDKETLKLVTMVYAGYINKQIVARLQAAGCAAIGLCGADGNLVLARKREVKGTVDYGFAGDVVGVNKTLLQQLLAGERIPVIAPITHDGAGQLLNTNADTIAQEIARAMSDTYTIRLIYCFEKEGVLRDIADETSVLPLLRKGEVEGLIAEGTIAGGMVPKIHNALQALDKGVGEVIIGKATRLPELLGGMAGTSIKHD